MGDEERVQVALQDISAGMSERRAAAVHGIGRRKLQSRRNGSQPKETYVKTVLTPEEEVAFVKAAIGLIDWAWDGHLRGSKRWRS